MFPGREITSALISSWIPILTSNTDSRCAYPSVIHMMFLPVVRSASKTCKTSLGISDSRISRVKSGSITPRSSCEQSVVLSFILVGCIIPNLLPSCFSHRLSFAYLPMAVRCRCCRPGQALPRTCASQWRRAAARVRAPLRQGRGASPQIGVIRNQRRKMTYGYIRVSSDNQSVLAQPQTEILNQNFWYNMRKKAKGYLTWLSTS